jgi:PhnB protein
MDLVTYLGFDGSCEQAFKHYEKVLRGNILMMMRMSDASPGTPITPGAEHRIMHARLQVGDRLLMGGDAPVSQFSKPQGFCVSIQADTAAEAERIFHALADGGKVNMPIGETFWAERFGMLIDKFGIPWMVNFEKPMGGQPAAAKPAKSAKPAKARKT